MYHFVTAFKTVDQSRLDDFVARASQNLRDSGDFSDVTVVGHQGDALVVALTSEIQSEMDIRGLVKNALADEEDRQFSWMHPVTVDKDSNWIVDKEGNPVSEAITNTYHKILMVRDHYGINV